MDIFPPEKRSEIMARIKGKGTKLEDKGWTLLKEAGVRFRKHPKGVPGNPDAGHKGKKIAVFFDSEFWHGYDWENQKQTIKSKHEFWIPKIERNIARDREVDSLLRRKGWKVIRIWSKELRKQTKTRTLLRIKKAWNSK